MNNLLFVIRANWLKSISKTKIFYKNKIKLIKKIYFKN